MYSIHILKTHSSRRAPSVVWDEGGGAGEGKVAVLGGSIGEGKVVVLVKARWWYW